MYVFNLHFEDTWEDDIKTDVEGMGREGTDWIHLAQVRNKLHALADIVMHFQGPQIAGNCLNS